MSLSDVSTILWRERQLLELLLFKLEEEQLLLAAGRVRFLAHATREVESVLEEIKRAELARAVEVDAVARQLGLGSCPSLRDLVEVATEPWRSVLADHRDAFLVATQEITAVAQANRELLTTGQRSIAEALRSVGGVGDDTYTPAGGGPRRPRSAMLLDQEL